MADRQQILDQFAQNFGLVPDFLSEMPDPVLRSFAMLVKLLYPLPTRSPDEALGKKEPE